MDAYIMGLAIKRLRQKRGITQVELAQELGVCSKAVSKWERARGLPDIMMLKPLSKALGVSVTELMTGESVRNQNVSCNMLRTQFYGCPSCGNLIHAAGNAYISCCGTSLQPLEAKALDEEHCVHWQAVEDEHCIEICHSMSKQHYISYVAYVQSDRVQLVKLYPEGDAKTRLRLYGGGYLYVFCSRDGLYRCRV